MVQILFSCTWSKYAEKIMIRRISMKAKKLLSVIVTFTLVLAMALSSVPVQAAEPSQEVCEVFADVKHNAWYEDAVQYVYDKGIMNGSNGTFRPSDNVTRAQLVTTLYRMAGEPIVRDRRAVEEFSDVAEGKYYTDAVCWAYIMGITTGSNGLFKPNDAVTREQIVVFLHRYSSRLNIHYLDNFGIYIQNNYSDYARNDVFWAVGHGFLTGTVVIDDSGYRCLDVNPKGNATRAQVATILMRFCERYGVRYGKIND